MRPVVVAALLLALVGCTSDPAATPGPGPGPTTAPAGLTSISTPPSALQHGLLARLAADPAVIKEMIGSRPWGVVLCGIDVLGHSGGERYAWLMCGDYRTGPDAKLLSASAKPVVLRGDGVVFPRQAHLDEDYDRLFPPDVEHAIRHRHFALTPTDDELLALATAAAPAAAPSP
jgi:hypothetical protein